MLAHTIAHGGCLNMVRESALNVNFGKTNSCCIPLPAPTLTQLSYILIPFCFTSLDWEKAKGIRVMERTASEVTDSQRVPPAVCFVGLGVIDYWLVLTQYYKGWTECRTRQWEYYWEPSRTNSRSHAGNCQGQTHKVMLGTMKDKPTESYWEPWRTNPQSNTGNHQGQTHRAILGTIKDKPTQ